MTSKFLESLKALFGLRSAAPDRLANATVSELIEAFRAQPARFLKGLGPSSSYPWPNEAPFSLPSMFFQYRGVAFGYAHTLKIEQADSARTLVVGHFAIGEGRETRQGLGRCLAHWLRDEFKRRYAITHIRFEEAESDKRPQDPAFFAAIGAVYQGKNGGNKQVYLWAV